MRGLRSRLQRLVLLVLRSTRLEAYRRPIVAENIEGVAIN